MTRLDQTKKVFFLVYLIFEFKLVNTVLNTRERENKNHKNWKEYLRNLYHDYLPIEYWTQCNKMGKSASGFYDLVTAIKCYDWIKDHNLRFIFLISKWLKLILYFFTFQSVCIKAYNNNKFKLLLPKFSS